MDTFLAWVVAIGLLVGVSLLSNAWLGIAATAVWSLAWRSYHRRHRIEELSPEVDRGTAVRERIAKWEHETDEGFLFFFAWPSLAIVAAVAKFSFDISLSHVSFHDRPFWVIVLVGLALGFVLQKIVFFILWARARAKYPGAFERRET